jgi:hypothetical protein
MSASGQLGKSIVFGQWKGIDTARQHVVPANPDTLAQQAVRNRMTACVASFRNYITAAAGRTAWNVAASAMSSTLSGFNAFVAACYGVTTTDADGSFATACTPLAAYKVELPMINIDDGAAGDEAGNFEIWYGTKPTSLLLLESAAIANAKVTSVNALGTAAGYVYCQIRKGGEARSGIFRPLLKLA